MKTAGDTRKNIERIQGERIRLLEQANKPSALGGNVGEYFSDYSNGDKPTALTQFRVLRNRIAMLIKQGRLD